MIEVKRVSKSYSKGKYWFREDNQTVLKEITFTVEAGECVGLVGESGSGKSTLSRIITGLEKADKGDVLIDRKVVPEWRKENKGRMSIVFQDYASSVNPNFTVKEIISEPLLALGQKNDRIEIINELLEKFRLTKSLLNRYPHEISGGQLQRVCLLRAISTSPRFLVLDEALSALDAPTQSQLLELLTRIKRESRVTYLFITHDILSAVKLCDRILFLYKGEIVEQIATNQLAYVQHEYSKKLLHSVANVIFQENKRGVF
ncbi:ABC-type dipeptide/oligopeptide/nickel transport system, ATPase component [Schinkia azotoformans MEV2011]|uniref:ABC-type dipeptide/oligopeptide/nickel transport system, ATPase component n=2 Tax=Schinkia azotoformans TaxID=1454 RepID=A0A072NJ46_SCHAZ|nr:ABC transporter ATP-binding protein [Schinkia azotoformans]KEF37292.1 ABC-type dipeptide/oligopeptide/nickel transport system, ATPase component [Schinkia azotoformans MEV2011]MEC1697550.1 ABC transporter ATP-binding protein [Schinkia azotoformans]MEC1718471.1 ABC transporter ATP-binding protein [Schinkia azotoformans]MEC1727382.1 ABC transporter ATP-binding protein [Schinkia azotoformans]MEC1743657.1 ABC transporter ATP-binding protein [Schinkia azotoformans]